MEGNIKFSASSNSIQNETNFNKHLKIIRTNFEIKNEVKLIANENYAL